MSVSYLFRWCLLFLLFQISTIASSKMMTRRRSMPPPRPAAIGITGRFVELGSVWLLLLVSGVVGSAEDGMVIGMHIGLLSSLKDTEQSPETVIGTPLTVIDGLVCTIVAIMKVLFIPSELIILARKVTCAVLLLSLHMSLTPPMHIVLFPGLCPSPTYFCISKRWEQ